MSIKEEETMNAALAACVSTMKNPIAITHKKGSVVTVASAYRVTDKRVKAVRERTGLTTIKIGDYIINYGSGNFGWITKESFADAYEVVS
jgi:hypothetical protein